MDNKQQPLYRTADLQHAGIALMCGFSIIRKESDPYNPRRIFFVFDCTEENYADAILRMLDKNDRAIQFQKNNIKLTIAKGESVMEKHPIKDLAQGIPTINEMFLQSKNLLRIVHSDDTGPK